MYYLLGEFRYCSIHVLKIIMLKLIVLYTVAVLRLCTHTRSWHERYIGLTLDKLQSLCIRNIDYIFQMKCTAVISPGPRLQAYLYCILLMNTCILWHMRSVSTFLRPCNNDSRYAKQYIYPENISEPIVYWWITRSFQAGCFFIFFSPFFCNVTAETF